MARGGHQLTLLQSGKVLVSGGVQSGYYYELYDPILNSFSIISNSSEVAQRTSHTATLLGDGRVLIAGGFGTVGGIGGITSSVEIYSPVTNSLSKGVGLFYSRAYHGAVKLQNGNVLLAFGNPRGAQNLLQTELFDPLTNRFTLSTNSNLPRSFSQGDSVHLFSDGSVFASGYIGSLGKAEVYK